MTVEEFEKLRMCDLVFDKNSRCPYELVSKLESTSRVILKRFNWGEKKSVEMSVFYLLKNFETVQNPDDIAILPNHKQIIQKLNELQKDLRHVNQKNSIGRNWDEVINGLSKDIYKKNFNVGWWTNNDLELMGKDHTTLVASKLALIHSEVSEALEGIRKDLNDDHLTHRKMVDVELGDAVIRIFDLCGYLGVPIGDVIREKLEYNSRREDHKLENRQKENGKTI